VAGTLIGPRPLPARERARVDQGSAPAHAAGWQLRALGLSVLFKECPTPTRPQVMRGKLAPFEWANPARSITHVFLPLLPTLAAQCQKGARGLERDLPPEPAAFADMI